MNTTFVGVCFEKIEIIIPPTKTDDGVDNLLDLTGMQVSAVYTDGTNDVIAANQYTVDPVASTTLTVADKKITATYTADNAKTAETPITVDTAANWLTKANTAIAAAVKAIKPTNATTAQEIFAAAEKAAKANLSTIAWKNSEPAKLDPGPACEAKWTTDGTNHWHMCTAANCPETTKDVAAHTPSDWIVDKAATADAKGSQHKECTICKLTLVTEKIPMKPYTSEVISGGNSKWTPDSGEGLTFIINADFTKFVELKIGGIVIDKPY